MRPGFRRTGRSRLPLFACALALLASAAVLAGCGSGGEKAKTTSDAAVATFANRANAICNNYHNRIVALGDPEPGLAGIPPYIDKALPIIRSSFNRLRALEPPTYAVTTMRQWMETGDILIRELTLMKRAAIRRDRSEVNRLKVAISRNNAKGRAYARQLGLSSCSQ